LFDNSCLWRSMLQCVAVCCSVLQCVAVCCSVLQCVAAWYTCVHILCIFDGCEHADESVWHTYLHSISVCPTHVHIKMCVSDVYICSHYECVWYACMHTRMSVCHIYLCRLWVCNGAPSGRMCQCEQADNGSRLCSMATGASAPWRPAVGPSRRSQHGARSLHLLSLINKIIHGVFSFAASAAKFDISSPSERAVPGFCGNFFGCWTPSNRGVLVHKNSLASCQRCRHSVVPRALTCPFKRSNLSTWSLLSWHPAHTYL